MRDPVFWWCPTPIPCNPMKPASNTPSSIPKLISNWHRGPLLIFGPNVSTKNFELSLAALHRLTLNNGWMTDTQSYDHWQEPKAGAKQSKLKSFCAWSSRVITKTINNWCHRGALKWSRLLELSIANEPPSGLNCADCIVMSDHCCSLTAKGAPIKPDSKWISEQ